ncbi:hypothetical protein NDR87_36805 [Nocardia sp. CDC159]|uniref:Uncharacterized protein n=1 Tax=Nocardia pulmonis TaxID=2951408 RepID=A0A9X2J0X9_9NOCA|nr:MULTISPECIES: hypothetical protein [Nocardia]MCM6779048.1 hypothetical protein [Nocardia pulmonis]MCM6791938.1 hypothetical protein [Nocardia sp. CDC159]
MSIFHRIPGHAMSPERMHLEVRHERHADCTLGTCDMKRFCWIRLVELGHPHPGDSPSECPRCRTAA